MFLNCFLVQSFVVKPRFCGVSPFVIKTLSIHIHRDNFFGSVVEWILSVMFRRDNNLHFRSQYSVVYSFGCFWGDSKNFTHNFFPDTCRAQLLVNIKVAAKIKTDCASAWHNRPRPTRRPAQWQWLVNRDLDATMHPVGVQGSSGWGRARGKCAHR